jgi:hypothetical protein
MQNLMELQFQKLCEKQFLEKIEDESYIFLYEKAYEQNPKTYTIEEAKPLLGIN